MAVMIRRTIKPAEGNSQVSAEAAMAAARLVYRDRATGRFVILENDRPIVHRSHGAEARRRDHTRNPTGHIKGSSSRTTSERGSAKKQ